MASPNTKGFCKLVVGTKLEVVALDDDDESVEVEDENASEGDAKVLAEKAGTVAAPKSALNPPNKSVEGAVSFPRFLRFLSFVSSVASDVGFASSSSLGGADDAKAAAVSGAYSFGVSVTVGPSPAAGSPNEGAAGA